MGKKNSNKVHIGNHEIKMVCKRRETTIKSMCTTLSKKIGISFTTLHNCITDQRILPEYIEPIAVYLNTTSRYLTGKYKVPYTGEYPGDEMDDDGNYIPWHAENDSIEKVTEENQLNDKLHKSLYDYYRFMYPRSPLNENELSDLDKLFIQSLIDDLVKNLRFFAIKSTNKS